MKRSINNSAGLQSKQIWMPVVFLICLAYMPSLHAQDAAEKTRTRLTIAMEKFFNGDRKITINLTAGRGKTAQKLNKAGIALSVYTIDSTCAIGEITTNSEGIAELLIQAGYKFLADDEGFTTLSASYEGDESNLPSSAEITFKDLIIEIMPGIVDSINTVNLFAYETDTSGEKIPVEGLDIVIGVDRLFSLLPVGEIQTDSEGSGAIEFPNDLPGDSLGSLKIIARLEDNEFYGTVSTLISIKWGIPVSYVIEPLPRQLWSNEAPLWMIFSVFIVLSAAWFHFFLAVKKLWKVKNAMDAVEG